MSRFYEIIYGLGGGYTGGQTHEIIETPDDFTGSKAIGYAMEKAQEDFDSYGLGDYNVDEDDEDYEEIDEECYYQDEFDSWAVYSVEYEFKARTLEELREELKKLHGCYYSQYADEIEDYITKI